MGRPRIHFLAGKTFGRLTVLRPITSEKWECLCTCGKTSFVRTGNLVQGSTTSCGCFEIESRGTHRASRTKTYWIWKNMRLRCSNPKAPNFPNYGGRGIFVCERWQRFENFLSDMGHVPPGLTLERTNNDGPYAPENCVWATPQEQSRNRRTSKWGTAFGETKLLEEWARDQRCLVSQSGLRWRLLAGWTLERAMTTAAQPGRSYKYLLLHSTGEVSA